MKWPAVLGLGVGLAAVATVLATSNLGQIGRALGVAGWGILAVIVVHLPQTVFVTFGWRDLIPAPSRPTWARLFTFRFIKEAVNSLLPVAQLGGDVVRARLLALRGVSLKTAAASCTVDAVVGVLSLFAYTLVGLAALLVAPHDSQAAPVAIRTILVGGAAAIILFIAIRLGLLKLVEAGLKRLSGGAAGGLLGDLAGLNDAVVALYKEPGRLWRAGFYHFTAWALGAFETFTALWVLGQHPSLREALVIDALGQAAKGLGFAVPGALGIQEGGYVLVCSLFGVSAETAVALSLIKRIREVALGVPGLIAWHRLEGRALAAQERPAA